MCLLSKQQNVEATENMAEKLEQSVEYEQITVINHVDPVNTNVATGCSMII